MILWRHWRTGDLYRITAIRQTDRFGIMVFYRNIHRLEEYARPLAEFFGKVNKPGVAYQGNRFEVVRFEEVKL